MRLGDAGDYQCGADDSVGGSEDCAGGRDGGDVAGSICDSRARWIYSVAGWQAGRLADGGVTRQLLRAVHGEYGGAVRFRTWHYAADAGRVRAALPAEGRCGL